MRKRLKDTPDRIIKTSSKRRMKNQNFRTMRVEFPLPFDFTNLILIYLVTDNSRYKTYRRV
jgi:hypothetical protein